MCPTNDILPFCPTDTGLNLLSQSAYAADPQLAIGNQPGTARQKLVNKVLRQSSFVASQIAQLVSDSTNTSVVDDNDDVKLLAQMKAALTLLPPVVDTITATGSGTWNKSYAFFIATGSATAGATYTNNAVTFTVRDTIASGLIVVMSGSGAPSASGVLTKASGTGDATLTFYAVRKPVSLEVEGVSGGGGGAGSSNSAGDGHDGGDGGVTSFGTSLFSATGGAKGLGSLNTGGAGGVPTITSPAIRLAAAPGGYGGTAMDGSVSQYPVSGFGGSSYYGGSGGVTIAGVGLAGAANTGSGGGGGSGSIGGRSGPGGGAGGFFRGLITGSTLSSNATFPFVVGLGGTAGAAGTTGFVGGVGGTGYLAIKVNFQ